MSKHYKINKPYAAQPLPSLSLPQFGPRRIPGFSTPFFSERQGPKINLRTKLYCNPLRGIDDD